MTTDAASYQVRGNYLEPSSGFSTPGTQYAITNPNADDVVFLLSFGEAARYCSTQYATSPTNYVQSSTIAAANFRKLNPQPPYGQAFNHWWLRSPGALGDRVCSVGLGGFNIWGNDAMNGAVFQYYQGDTHWYRPALWVDAGIFYDTYTLTYNANGGNASSVPPPVTNITSGSTVTISSTIPTHSNTSLQFLGWHTSSTATTPQYLPGSSIVVSANTTLYAVWGSTPPPTYTLSYNANGGNPGSVPPSQPNLPAGSTAPISGIIPTHSENRAFLGWHTNPSAATPIYLPNGTVQMTGNIVLYAIWGDAPIERVDLRYSANGGNGAPPDQLGIPRYTSVPISQQRPYLDGYTFLGWHTNSSATTPYYQPGDSIYMSAHITLYAVWRKDDEPPPDPDEEEAAITKLLKVPYGTLVPNARFTFDVRAWCVDTPTPAITNYTGNSASGTSNMPVVGETGTTNLNTGVGSFTLEFGKTPPGEKLVMPNPDSTDTTNYSYETPNIFANAVWPHAGEYHYRITERTGTYSISDGSREWLIYSQAEYLVKVFVRESNEIPGKYVIFAINAFRVKDDNGAASDEKVDPSPGEGGMSFTNKYWHHNGGSDPKIPGHWTLSVSKKTIGATANPQQYFDFSMTVVAPFIIPTAQVYRAYIVEYNSSTSSYTVVNPPALSSNNVTPGGQVNGNTYINFSSGVPVTFSLKHNQYLVFLDTPVGTKYTVTENPNAMHKPSVTVIYNGGNTNTTYAGGGATFTYTSSQANVSVTIPSLSTIPGLLSGPSQVGKLFVGELANSADFVNDSIGSTPTGLDLYDLPFISLIALSIAALCTLSIIAAVKVVKSRRKYHF